MEQARAAISAVALKKLWRNFINRMTECGNDIGSIDVISCWTSSPLGRGGVVPGWPGQRRRPGVFEILNSRDDIHDLLEYFLRREGRAIAQRMLEAFDPSMIFAQMLATAVEVEGLEPEECASPEVYRQAVEACFGRVEQLLCGLRGLLRVDQRRHGAVKAGRQRPVGICFFPGNVI